MRSTRRQHYARWLACLLVLALLPCHAQAGEQQHLTTQAEVVRFIATATGEVMLAAPTLRSRLVAEALREAMVVRGVEVYLLLTPQGVEERASYAMSLSLAGAHVRVGSIAASYLVVDRHSSIVGPLVSELEAGQVMGPTSLSEDSAYIQEVVAWFYQSFRAAQAYEPSLSRLQTLESKP